MNPLRSSTSHLRTALIYSASNAPPSFRRFSSLQNLHKKSGSLKRVAIIAYGTFVGGYAALGGALGGLVMSLENSDRQRLHPNEDERFKAPLRIVSGIFLGTLIGGGLGVIAPFFYLHEKLLECCSCPTYRGPGDDVPPIVIP